MRYKLGVQCRTPSRSDRFNGVTGGAGGPKGRNRNLPRPPCKKIIKKLIFFLFGLLPQSRLRLDSSPARGGAFWRSANSYVKPALKGEVDMSVSEWTEGLHRGFACLRQPLSQSALRRIASSPAGEPFGLPQSNLRFASSLSEGAFWHCTTQKLSPRAGKVARSAERGAAQRWLQVQRAAGGVASRLLLFTPTPQSATLPAPRPGSLLGTVPPNARARYPANYRLYA